MDPRYTSKEMIEWIDQAITDLLANPSMKLRAESLYAHRELLTQPENLELLTHIMMYLEDRA